VSAGTLYVVSTPIGNLKDITQRALETLERVDLIAAEDTRHTGLLLKAHGLRKPMVSYHEHNERERAAQLVTQLEGGRHIALVSDAGTPGISDPGYRIIHLAAERGIRVEPIPGASALLAALAASALPTDRFLFEGFLPRKKGRKTRLESLAAFEGTVVVYESARRVPKTLADILNVFGDRQAALCRELTKKFETVLRGRVTDILGRLGATPLKGECVLVIGKEGLP